MLRVEGIAVWQALPQPYTMHILRTCLVRAILVRMEESLVMNSSAPLRALLLDLGGVVIVPQNSPRRQYWLDRVGRQNEELAAWLWSSPPARAAMRGELSLTQFWRAVGAELGLSAKDADSFGRAYWAGDKVNDVVVSLARRAKAHGILVGVLSNAYGDLNKLLAEHSLLDLFDEVVNSSVEGLTKPDVAIYHLACSRLGAPPQNTLFIDDRHDNVEGALKAGLHALHYAGEDTVVEATRLLGLPPSC